jgi:hypothetical protein
MIREWTVSDALEGGRLSRFMKAFEGVTKHVKVDVQYTHDKYVEMMKAGIARILVAENEDRSFQGALGFIVSNDLHDGKKVAIETFWFALPQYKGAGGRLFRAFEEAAKRIGCGRTAMIHLIDSYPDSLEGYYLKNGYTLVEKHYIKDI